MKRNIFLIIILVLLIGLTSFYFLSQKEKQTIGKELEVVVSILPQAEFVEKIGGDKIKVTVMIPSGANLHTYEPTSGQLKEVSQVKMYAKVGSPIEFELAWMDKIINTNKAMLIVDCSEGINFIETKQEHSTEGGIDPHIWLSLRNAKVMVENIYAGLVQIDPQNQEYYAQNKERYLQELASLDEEMSQIFTRASNKKFMVYHPSWGYLAQDYNLEQIPIEKEGKEPTPQGITKLIDQAQENNIKVIFTAPQFSPQKAELIAKEIEGRVVLIDPLARNYLENMRKVSQVLAETLK